MYGYYGEKLHFNHFWNQKGKLDGIHLFLCLMCVSHWFIFVCTFLIFSILYSIVVCGWLFLSAANVSMRA